MSSSDWFDCQWQIQDFPEGVANPWVWSENLLFGKIFAENRMKIKEHGRRGAILASSWRHTQTTISTQNEVRMSLYMGTDIQTELYKSSFVYFLSWYVLSYELKEQYFAESRFMTCDVEIFYFDVIFAVAVLGRN